MADPEGNEFCVLNSRTQEGQSRRSWETDRG